MKTILFLAAVTVSSFLVGSCATKEPEGPPRSDLSSMPHNMPATWEGQAGMPGMGGMQQY